MWGDVAAALSKCGLCSRVRSSPGGEQPELHPLPISGLMYRWGVDLCGPFSETPRGHQYVMVAVEHYSKHWELVPIPNKEPATTAAAFASAVLGRYGSPAEVVTDRGGEWMKEFEQLLLECMIDHRHTSASHPQLMGFLSAVWPLLNGHSASYALSRGISGTGICSCHGSCWDTTPALSSPQGWRPTSSCMQLLLQYPQQ